ncbi:MAG: hypothetical protein ACE5JU_01125 [Candidatus Binatia bacterium]
MTGRIQHHNCFSILGKKDGIVMLIALVITLLLTVLGLGTLLSSSKDILTTRSQGGGKKAFYAAEGGIVYGVKELNSLLVTTLAPTSAQLAAITAPSIPGFNFDSFSIVTSGSSALVALTTGPYAGLNSFATPYTITSQASGTATDSGTVRLTQTVQDELIPLFQFGVFYNDDLEIFPGPCMTFNGRVHSNSDLYIGPGSTSNCSPNPTVDSRMTSAGDIFRCRKDTPLSCGNAQIKRSDGTYASLTYDHTDPNWATKAYNDWGGLVQDSAHQVQALNLPMETTNPIDLIKRGDTIDPASSSESQSLKDSRLYWQADLRILDGTAYDLNGNDVTSSLPPGSISSANFFDYRENKSVEVIEIDCGNLGASAPANGILYASQTQSDPNVLKAIRLTNCATLPTGGLTVASDNPIYVKGDYNTVNKKGAAILGDAVTFLSNSWNDANSSLDLDTYRVASNTTVNAALATGNTTTTVGNYNGGLENLPRFLEKWSGKTFTYKGSLVNLWQSQQATGAWCYGYNEGCPIMGIYKAPNRVWSYDTDFNDPANLPPGTPSVRTLARNQWARW